MDNKSAQIFRSGLRDGIPIGLGYFAVAFSLGIAAKSADVSPFQGALTSLLCVASAGEYITFSLISAGASLIELAVMVFITNIRYLLMSLAYVQRFNPGTKLGTRILMGYGITDELFGISIARPGYLRPYYTFGAMIAAIPLWVLGTYLGIVMGNILPSRIVSALSVALFGMFIAVFIPESKKNKVVAVLVIVSFALSAAWQYIPFLNTVSEGTKTIILVLAIAGTATFIRPIETKDD